MHQPQRFARDFLALAQLVGSRLVLIRLCLDLRCHLPRSWAVTGCAAVPENPGWRPGPLSCLSLDRLSALLGFRRSTLSGSHVIPSWQCAPNWRLQKIVQSVEVHLFTTWAGHLYIYIHIYIYIYIQLYDSMVYLN